MTLIRDASVGLKFALAPGLAIILMLLLGFLAWSSSRSLSKDLEDVGQHGLQRVAEAKDLLRRITELQLGINQSLAYEGMGQRPETIKAIDEQLVRDMAKTKESLDRFAAQNGASGEMTRQYAGFVKAINDMIELKSVQLATAGGFAATLAESYGSLRKSLDAIVETEMRAATASAKEGATRADRTQLMSALLLLMAVAAATGLTLWTRRSIVSSLKVAEAQAEALKSGDLRPTSFDAGRDETGRVISALQSTSTSLQGLVQQVRAGAEQINLAADEIASGNQDLSSRTENTAAALQQTSASIEELNQTTRNSADNAREANRMAHQAAAVAREGGSAVGEVVATMDDINAQARRIAEIIGVIDGIAFQTNILALNAAVEAARAGEQGRGFAVVAGEVRLLAQRSAEAAKEIRMLIQASVERIDGGVEKVQKAGQTMARIVTAIGRVTQMVDDVTRAAGEQASGIAQVHGAISEMDRNTQQNAAMVEQATAAAATLRTQAQQLVTALGRFQL